MLNATKFEFQPNIAVKTTANNNIVALLDRYVVMNFLSLEPNNILMI